MLLTEIFTAGQSKQFESPGHYLRIKSLTGVTRSSLRVTFYKDGKRLDIDLTDVDAGDYVDVPSGFDRFEVISTEAQTVVLQVVHSRDGRVGSDRIAGEVSVVDGGVSRSLATAAYWANPQVNPVAAQYSHAQLWNPAGSGKNLVVNTASLYIGGSGYMYVRWSATALAVNAGNPPPKLAGSAAVSVAQVRQENNAVMQGSGIATIYASANAEERLTWSEPMIVPPGKGLILVPAAVNIAMYARLEYWEVNI